MTSDFTIECENMLQIEVFSLDGRLVKRIQTESSVQQLEGLPNGTFLIKITTDEGMMVKKAVRL